jgi:hypothetical protein
MKTLAIREKRVRATTATMAVMAAKLQGMREIL